MFCAGLFSSSDTFTGCSGVVVTVLNVTHELVRVLLMCQNMLYDLNTSFFGAEHMKVF